MPRALPWATNGATKSGKDAVKKTKPAARQWKENASEDEFVTSDLDAIHPKKPDTNAPEKKRFRASSSSPPPPGPPAVERIKPGFAADDIYMMVEDEFYSTAQLYTGHIHHAEYARLKKLHKSRGQEILAGLGRGTDGKTEQSKALRTKMESLELAKKQKKTLQKMKINADSESDAEGSEAEDEYMQDPHLAGLMRASQMAPSQDLSGVANPRADTRAAAGYSQSPYKAARTKDVFAEEKQQQERTRLSQVGEHEADFGGHGILTGARRIGQSSTPAADEYSETDDDDLDAGVPTNLERAAISACADNVVFPASKSRTKLKDEADVPRAHDSRPLARFAHPVAPKATTTHPTKRPSASSPEQDLQTVEGRNLSSKSVESEPVLSPPSTRPVSLLTPPRASRYLTTLARNRAERAAADAKGRTIKKEDVDEIPTFLF